MRRWSHHRRPRFRKQDTVSGQQCRRQPVLECLEERCLLSGGYTQVNLASDVPGLAPITNPSLVNPWGIASSPTGPFWFADNGNGASSLLEGRGEPLPLLVTVPPTTQSGGTPTGTVFNSGPGFLVSENGLAAPSRILFATEDGTISGWTAVLDWTHAILAVDHSASGAVYKGLALATDPAGRSLLYAADFGRGTIDVFDQDFKPVEHSGSFEDPTLPDGFVPFNIENIHDLLFVTYAQHDGVDDNPGAGHGFIDVYDTAGTLVKRLASQGPLNSPWGLALAPAGFGPFAGALLVGNNGDGHINAYDPLSGAFLGTLAGEDGSPVTIPGLWGLRFGNGRLGGAADTLFFTAGVQNEQHGLFGALQAPQRKGADTAGPAPFDPHAPGEPGDYPLPPATGPILPETDEQAGFARATLLRTTESSVTLVPTLLPAADQRESAGTRVAATPAGSSFLPVSVAAEPLVADFTKFAFHHINAPAPRGSENDVLALHTSFILISAQPSPEKPTREEPLESVADAGDAGRSPLTAADPNAAGQPAGGQIVAPRARPIPPRPAPVLLAPARDAAARTNDRSNWTELVKRFVMVVSLPLFSTLCMGPAAASLSPIRKAPRLATVGNDDAATRD